MMKRKNMGPLYFLGGLFMIFALIAVMAVLLRGWFQPADYPYPMGLYEVGTLKMELEDAERKEFFHGDGTENRKLMIRVWYPAKDIEGYTPIPLMDTETNLAFMESLHMLPFPGEEELSYSYENAPPLQKENTPVIVFSHGYGSFETQNISLMEHLASSGYCVIAVNHTYDSALSIFPDGKRSRLRPEYWETVRSWTSEDLEELYGLYADLLSAETVEESAAAAQVLGESDFGMLQTSLEVWTEDIRFIRRELENSDLPPFRRINADWSHWGYIGHSFGGITAYRLAADPPEGLRCVISLDGPGVLFPGEEVLSAHCPVLALQAEKLSLGPAMNLTGGNRLLHFEEAAEAPFYTLMVKGTAHYDFTDMKLAPPVLQLAGIIGPIDPQRMIMIQRAYTSDFFDFYLRGFESRLKTDLYGEFQEVRFISDMGESLYSTEKP